jgi:hypothetical protein
MTLRPDPRQISGALREMRLRDLLGRLEKAAYTLGYLQLDEPDKAPALWSVEDALAEAIEWAAEALDELRAANLAGTGGRS